MKRIIAAVASKSLARQPLQSKCIAAEELLVPQRGHGIHLCGTAGRDIAREQGYAHQQDSDGGIGCGIGGLDAKEPEVLRHEPIESER